MSSWQSARASLAINTRHHGPDSPEALHARRELRTARAEEYIKRLVAEAPPLSAEQRDRLALLLRSDAA